MTGTRSRATLYVIVGSHACRTGMLLLEHKGIPYRTVELITGPHPFSVRMRGFAGNDPPIRNVEGGVHRSLALMDRMGTVPAVKLGHERAQTNRAIARMLERVQPTPALFPEDPPRRLEVEQAERWGDEVLQMAARRIVLVAGVHGLDALHEKGGAGRLGPLLSRREPVRVVASKTAARFLFRTTSANEPAQLDELPAMLDRVDDWIAAGVLGGESLNAADLMIVTSLALLTYRNDLREQLEARPLTTLLDRVLPEPGRQPSREPVGSG